MGKTPASTMLTPAALQDHIIGRPVGDPVAPKWILRLEHGSPSPGGPGGSRSVRSQPVSVSSRSGMAPWESASLLSPQGQAAAAGLWTTLGDALPQYIPQQEDSQEGSQQNLPLQISLLTKGPF